MQLTFRHAVPSKHGVINMHKRETDMPRPM